MGAADATVKRVTKKVIMGPPEILDQVPDSRGSKDLTGQSSDNAQHLCVNLAFHRGVLRS